MSSRFPLCSARRLLIWGILLATLTSTTQTSSVQADERDQYRAKFQQCPDLDLYPALDGFYPERSRDGNDAHFYYIADVEVCPDARTVSIRHTVINLGQTGRLTFKWEGTTASHVGLLPGKDCCTALNLIQYEGNPSSSRIMYGASLTYPVPASIYPVLELAEEDIHAPSIGDVLVSKLETEYIDANQRHVHVSFEASSSYGEDGSISYSFTKEPADLVIALGGISHTSAGELIASSFSADVGFLEKFVDESSMGRIPAIFSEEEFLIVPAEADLSGEIVMQETPTMMTIVPVAVLNQQFEPIVTNAVTLLTP